MAKQLTIVTSYGKAVNNCYILWQRGEQLLHLRAKRLTVVTCYGKTVTIVTSYGKHNYFVVNPEKADVSEHSSSIQKKAL